MMPAYIKKNHLRLVSSTAEAIPGKPVLINSLTREELARKNNAPLLLFVKEEEILRSDEFLALLEEMVPAWIFDLRISPRLDIVAPNRLLAFNIFSSLEINYADMAGALSRSIYSKQNDCSESWLSFVISKIMTSNDRRVCIFLVDSEDALSRAAQRIYGEICIANIFENCLISRFRPERDFLLSM
jgi:hypothetical protein